MASEKASRATVTVVDARALAAKRPRSYEVVVRHRLRA
jgi:hypothetical protein